MLKHCWRWFGPEDGITLSEIVQTGAQGIVTALHGFPAGEAWPEYAIRERKQLIEKAGLTWEVVESIPVHEDIKLRTGRFDTRISNFCTTLQRLGEQGIRTVCYNFMPALDWSRTELAFRAADGSGFTSFNRVHFAAIDLFLLHRPGAESDYREHIRMEARNYLDSLDEAGVRKLSETFLLGFPGSGEKFTMKEVRERISAYDGLDKDTFRNHLAAFLGEVVPVAEKAGVRLAIHPDDPPWPLMGMPRVFSTLEDALFITGAMDSPANGITLCTGSLGALYSNDPGSMAERLAGRIHFGHLRNVCRDSELNFNESHLLEGHVDMRRVVAALVRESDRREKEGSAPIPVRPDHGALILGDHQRTCYPGYSLYGRMKSLAEIRGLEEGIRFGLETTR